jgi:hypothetical protein
VIILYLIIRLFLRMCDTKVSYFVLLKKGPFFQIYDLWLQHLGKLDHEIGVCETMGAKLKSCCPSRAIFFSFLDKLFLHLIDLNKSFYAHIRER